MKPADEQFDDPLLESLLSEAVGGTAPPDLSARILAAAGRDCAAVELADRSTVRRATRRRTRIAIWTLVAAVVLVAITIIDPFGAIHPFGASDPRTPELVLNNHDFGDRLVLPTPSPTDEEAVAFIDRSMRRIWRAANVEPSPAATDAEWCRRVYLALAGRIPTLPELGAGLSESSDANKTWDKFGLVEWLLKSNSRRFDGPRLQDGPPRQDGDDATREFVRQQWAELFGYDLADDALIDGLHLRFVAVDRDASALVRWLLLSEAYGLSSKSGKSNAADDPLSGRPPLFSRYYLRPMTPEQLRRSLAVAADADRAWEMDNDSATFVPTSLSATAAESLAGLVPQAFSLSERLVDRGADEDNFLNRTAESAGPIDQKVGCLFLAAVARPPSQRELAMAGGLVSQYQGNTAAALEDVWWALLNSNEFILDH